MFSIDREQAEPAYVRWIARWPTFWDRLVPRGSMVRRKRVQVSQLLEVTVPLPELEQQRRTVAELEIVQAATNRIATLDKRSDTFVSALPRLVDEVVGRASSRRAFVGDLVHLVSDTVHPGDSPGDARSFVGLQHVERHTGRRTGADPIEAMTGRKFRFRPGDVIYGYLRPHLNKVWAADRHGLCSVDQYVLRPKPTVTPEVIAYVLRGQSVLDQTIALTHSLQLPRLRSGLHVAGSSGRRWTRGRGGAEASRQAPRSSRDDRHAPRPPGPRHQRPRTCGSQSGIRSRLTQVTAR